MGWWLPWQPRAGGEKAIPKLCRKILLEVRTITAPWYRGEQAEAVPRAHTAGKQAAGSAAGLMDAVLVLWEQVMPGHGWLELREAQAGLVQEVCSHPSSPALGEGTGWHSSLQGYPGPALLPPFQPLTKAPGSAVEQVLFFAVCRQGSVCPVPELGMCQLSCRCPPCGCWLHCVPLISLSGAGEPGWG